MENYGAIQQRGFLSKRRGGIISGDSHYNPAGAITDLLELVNKGYVDAFESIPANVLFVAKNGDDATGNGGLSKPYLTVQAAINKVIANGDNAADHGYLIQVAPGDYDETLVLESPLLVNLHIRGAGNRVTRINPTAGKSLQSEANNDNLVTFHINDMQFTKGAFDMVGASDGTAFGNDFVFESCFWTAAAPVLFQNCNSPNIAGYFEVYDLKYSNVACPSICGEAGVKPSGVTAFTIETDHTANKPSGWFGDAYGTYVFLAYTNVKAMTWSLLNGGHAFVQARMGTRLCGSVTIPADGEVLSYGAVLKDDWTIAVGGKLTLAGGSFCTGTLVNNGTLDLQQPASQVGNDSAIVGTTVKDALETLAALVAGLTAGNQHADVRAASTADIDLTTGGLLTIDGVVLVATDRVLVKNQAATEENGLYAAANGAWGRVTDMDITAEATIDQWCFVSEGTVGANTGWRISTPPATLDTDPLLWSQFTGAGAAPSGFQPTEDLTAQGADGTPTVFNTSTGYVATSLKVYLNGMRMREGAANDYVETTPATGVFTFTAGSTPLAGDSVLVDLTRV